MPLPIAGQGITPASGGIYNELQSIVRRAFIPNLIVQIYKANPVLSYLLRNAQRARGGMNQITIPIQGNPFVQWSWTGYDGGFPQPGVTPAVQNAQFPLSLGVIPIPFLGPEGLIQSSETIINLTKARLTDAKTVALQNMAGVLYTNNTSDPLKVNSLYDAYDDGTNVSVYGGVNRLQTTPWASHVLTSAGGVLNRVAQAKYMVQSSFYAGGETPDIVILSLQDWATLMTDFIGAEQYNTSPGKTYGSDDVVNAGFRGISIADTFFFGDPFAPQGTAWFINTRYLALYLSEDAPFAFSGFYSSIPNFQIGNVGVVIVLYNVVCSKPVSGMQVTGITGGVAF
jgi:hypothetical protein